METEVNKQLIEELQRLNARVSQLEGFSDWVKGVVHSGHDMVFGKKNADLTQHDVSSVVAHADPNYKVHDNVYEFNVKGQSATLVWNQGDEKKPFDLKVGEQLMYPPDLKGLKAQLDICCKRSMSTPADLHAYTSAVLRQQARMGRYTV